MRVKHIKNMQFKPLDFQNSHPIKIYMKNLKDFSPSNLLACIVGVFHVSVSSNALGFIYYYFCFWEGSNALGLERNLVISEPNALEEIET